jgi:hypothetical protein
VSLLAMVVMYIRGCSSGGGSEGWVQKKRSARPRQDSLEAKRDRQTIALFRPRPC